ncbi:MAG: 6-phosphogluconolactonase [candidate division NC10 bacterium]|nr:6-phosphogluconolactonase [candidate division NC10 bacterium]
MESGQTVGYLSDLLVIADPTTLAREAATRLTRIAEEAVARCGRFVVALAGGSTPTRLYSLLAAEPYCTRLPWQNTHVFWGDERAVPPEHPDSNFGMAATILLNRVPIPADQVHRMQVEQADLDATAGEYQAEIARTLAAQPSDEPPAFDLILLGLGTDGHTASLFPYTQALRETARWVVSNYIPELKATRLTLTIPILNRGATILFLVSGAEKASVLQAVLQGPADPERLPAQLIRPVTGRLVWLVDQAAASRLGKMAP